MDLDALISLIRRAGPPAASPTANEREAIFHHATARLESGTARRRTGPTGWTGTWRRSASLAVAVVVTVALGATAAIVVTHLGGRARVKPTGTTGPSKHHVNHKHPGHPNPVAVLDRTCAAAPSDPQVVAYVVRAFYTQPSQPDQVAAIDLPSGRLAWSRPLPDHLSSIAALAVAPNGKTVYAVASGSAQFSQETEYLVALEAPTGSARVLTSMRGPTPYSGGLAISPDGHYALVAHTGSAAIDLPGPSGDTVTEVDLAHPSGTSTSTTTITIASKSPAGSGPWGVAFAPSGIAYVTSFDGLSKLNMTQRRVILTIRFPQREPTPGSAFQVLPGAIAVSPTGTLALVGNHGADLVSPSPTVGVVSLADHRYERSIKMWDSATDTSSIAFDCTGSAAFAVTEYGIVRVNPMTMTAQGMSEYDAASLDLDTVASIPRTQAIWVSNTTERHTVFMLLNPSSTKAGPPIGSLPGSITAMALGITPQK
ncbi:MAG: YncE family protein [Acidimicrobiales bacterium]|jgi:hypothetical protein